MNTRLKLELKRFGAANGANIAMLTAMLIPAILADRKSVV